MRPSLPIGTTTTSRSVRWQWGSTGPRQAGRLRYFLPLAVVLMIVAVGALLDARGAAPVERPTPEHMPTPGFGPASFAHALADADGRIALGREQMRRLPGEWGPKEILAQGLMAKARLTGSYPMLAEARGLLDEAMAEAPKGAGPLVAHATLAFSTHRLAAVERDIALIEGAAVPPDRLQQSGIAGLVGDIAFYRGDMVEAARQYRRAAGLRDGPAVDYRRAGLAMAQARFADADAAILDMMSDKRPSAPRSLAEAAMQMGGHALAQGRWEEADRWFASADALFPGYWLIAAYRAQAEALTGDPARAAARMAAIAEASNSAEVMDAAAMLYRHLGDRANCLRWAARAGALWEARLRLLPEAAYGHAIEHELAFGTPDRALDLARKNVALRPYGESRLLLASALLMNNRPQDALAEIARAQKSGWRSAPLFAIKAEAAALAGQPALSQASRAEAEAINPRIFDPRTPLVWFAHG